MTAPNRILPLAPTPTQAEHKRQPQKHAKTNVKGKSMSISNTVAAPAAIVTEISRALDLDGSGNARANLKAALLDMGGEDDLCRATIRRVLGQLAEVERIVSAARH